MPAWWYTDAAAVSAVAVATQWISIALAVVAAILGGFSFLARNQHAALLGVGPRLAAAETAIRPRSLTADQRQALAGLLQPYAAKRTVTIASIYGDGEARRFADELQRVFAAAGFGDLPVNTELTSGRIEGIIMRVRSQAEKPAYAVDLQRMLNGAGLLTEGELRHDLPAGHLVLVVGHKPPPAK